MGADTIDPAADQKHAELQAINSGGDGSKLERTGSGKLVDLNSNLEAK